MLGPIFNREFLTVPRRGRHHTARVAALALLWVIGVTAWQATVGFTKDAALGETARFGLLLFQIVSFVELTLLVFFSSLSAASTVAQEKDRRTFILLLLTDMRDYEIVLGKMLGSLLPIAVLFAITVPFFALTLLLGGVSGAQVTQAVAVMAATALAAGSLGALVALWRERTFQALALSVLGIVFYLFIVQGVGLVGRLITGGADWSLITAWLDPFTAMLYVLEPPDPEPALHPAYGFAVSMALLCVALNGLGIWKLRKWNPSGEPVQQREAPEDSDDSPEIRAKAHAAPGPVRQVWANPILWREIRTLAYGRRPLLVKIAYGVVIALVCYFAFGALHSGPERPAFVAAYGLVPATILSLLLVSAQAVTSITSERDGKALDLLLVTDISPKEFVFGKLGGVLYNAKEFILPPLLIAVYYAVQGALAYTRGDDVAIVRNFGPLLCVLGAVLVLIAFVMTLGLHVALRIENSRLSVVHTLGTVFFLSVGALVSIYLIVINGGSLGNQLLSFSAFIGLGIGGLWWVLSADRPSAALTLASFLCPIAMFYSAVNILIGKPGSQESSDPLLPFLVIGAAFGFTIAAMLVPLLSEFDVALGRTTANEE
ncbi:MAG TPA: ABC transporter permease subunit [Gemmataceae bacterium]|nr:ABC transporter permease subunit [Gemmataceae bacterium]